jgi:hypothetical protein
LPAYPTCWTYNAIGNANTLLSLNESKCDSLLFIFFFWGGGGMRAWRMRVGLWPVNGRCCADSQFSRRLRWINILRVQS